MHPRKNFAAGLIAGVTSGLVGSWLMLRFIQSCGFQIQERLKSKDEHFKDITEAAQRQQHGESEPETVTMQAADVFASHAPGGRHLSRAEKERGATVVHYVFGAAMGIAYGLAAEYTAIPTLAGGALFGTVLWAATDLWSVPAVGFAKWPGEEPAGAHVSHWLAHLVYGTGMETTRRLLRRSLS